MAEESEKDFKARMTLECSKEVFELKKTEKPTEKQLKDIMKKYENKIYERFVKKPVVASTDNYDTANLDIRHSFTGNASFLSNYDKLLKGYRDETNFNAQKLPYEVKLPSQIGIFQPKNQFPVQKKNYSDTLANSKYYFPEDHDFDQFAAGNTGNIYNNKPTNDISNIQSRLLSQYMRPGLSDPYNQEEEIYSSFQNSGAVASGALLNSQQNMPSSLKINQQNFVPQELLYQTNFNQANSSAGMARTVSASPNRSRSPVKYETPALNKPMIYFSPTKKDQPVVREEPVAPVLPVVNPVPVEDKDFGRYKKPNFSSSRAQRDEKLAQYNSQFQMLQSVKLNS